MHEMSLMEGVFQIINQALAGREVSRVIRVSLSVGKLTNAVPESLQLCFQAFARGTLAEGAELDIIPVPLVVRCQVCGAAKELSRPVFLCPLCGSEQVVLISGRDLRVESLEVE